MLTITREERLKAAEELGKRVGIAAACDAVNVSRATLYRRREPGLQTPPSSTPSMALSAEERKVVLDQLNSECLADRAPQQIYAKLLDEGVYYCSVRTMYRILTPSSLHYDQADKILASRQQTLQIASQNNPERFVSGIPPSGTSSKGSLNKCVQKGT